MSDQGPIDPNHPAGPSAPPPAATPAEPQSPQQPPVAPPPPPYESTPQQSAPYPPGPTATGRPGEPGPAQPGELWQPTYGGTYQPGPSGPDTPLGKPYYGASFGVAVARYWKSYALFSGRASRSEYWWPYLVNAIVVAVFFWGLYVPGLAAASNGGSPALAIIGGVVSGVYLLVTVIPTYAIIWRRLHDVNIPGPWGLFVLLSTLGFIWSIVIGCLSPRPFGERFDRN